MGVIINKGNHIYDGTLTAAVDTVVGMFVSPNYTTGAAALSASGNYDGVCLLVNNVNFTIDQQGVADTTLTVKAGDYLRAKRMLPGETFTTDQFNGTYGTINVGDVFAPGAGGKIEAKAARTPAVTFIVREKTTLWGNNALRLECL